MTSSRVASAPIWIEPTPIPTDAPLADLHANPIIARLLYRRGYRDAMSAQAFTDPRPQPAPNPYGLPNMREAVARVGQAIVRRECIAIFGDYDADGVTSTALLVRALRAASDEELIAHYIPNRLQGYGLNEEGLDELRESGAGLLITVDCGSNDREQIAYAREIGFDVLVLDHHRISGELPEDAIIVNPQLLADGPYHSLTGVGVAYLLVSALAQAGYGVADQEDGTETGFLDLVAIGTIADVAPLDGINRGLVRDGLVELARTHRPGLRALLRNADLTQRDITATDVSFSIAPRINAAGRLDSPLLALDLLLAEDLTDAELHAQTLERVNQRRRVKTDELLAEAWSQIHHIPNWEARSVIVLSDPGWTGGLLGSAASRLLDELQRPVILFQEQNGILHGSARSVEGFDMVAALQQLDTLLLRYGGHSQAAGITIADENLDYLRDGLADIIAEQELEIPVPPRIAIDDDLSAHELSLDTVRAFSALEPLGNGNPTPIVRVRGAHVTRYTTLGRDNAHLKIQFELDGQQVTAVQWRAAERSHELVSTREIDIVGHLEINAWKGRETLQMLIKDFRPAAG